MTDFHYCLLQIHLVTVAFIAAIKMPLHHVEYVLRLFVNDLYCNETDLYINDL